jgi:hypothetical protein
LERQSGDVLWSGGIETVEMFDQVWAAEVVVWLPSVFAGVIAFPFDQVFHVVVVEAAVQNGFDVVFRNSVQEGGWRWGRSPTSGDRVCEGGSEFDYWEYWVELTV